jgi:hypothetical protein
MTGAQNKVKLLMNVNINVHLHLLLHSVKTLGIKPAKQTS